MPTQFAEYANIGKGLMKEISRPLIENSQGVAFTGIKQEESQSDKGDDEMPSVNTNIGCIYSHTVLNSTLSVMAQMALLVGYLERITALPVSEKRSDGRGIQSVLQGGASLS